MKPWKRPELNRKEDYLVNATLIVNGVEINDVPCKLYLPERPHEKPYVVFKPSNTDFHKITNSYKGSFKADIYGSDKQINSSIEAPEIHFSDSAIKNWGNGIAESTVYGEPQDLHIIRHLENPEKQDNTSIVFWISPNRFLSPFVMRRPSYTGEITCDRKRTLEFKIKDDVMLKFDKHYMSRYAENGDFIQWSNLVACADLNVPADNVETLNRYMLQDVDDFLLVSSFAAGNRIVCLGWDAVDKNYYATYYRGNYSFPENKKIDIDEGIIDIQEFERFMLTCYPTFVCFENKLALRHALYSAVPLKPATLEISFLNTFAGLETLILDFKRTENLEFILPEREWVSLRKHLQKCIKKSTEPKLERSQRASIYSKLCELNRTSLRETFEIFCQHHKIDLSDLWTVFGEKGTAGLSDIRNNLIHGDPFPQELLGALVVANEHLKYILERALIRVLGWDVEKTKVNSAYLGMHLTSIRDLPAEQARLSDFICIL